MASPGLCARFHKAVELIGRRWSGAIIQILRQRPSRYAELRTAIPDITDRMLSERLRELEDEAIVARTVIPETPVRVEYSLTAKGRALAPALDAIGHWAERWVEAADMAAAAPAASAASRKGRRQPVAALASRRSESGRSRH
jgi:DNA-binding HxlR family transcriptional regulator